MKWKLAGWVIYKKELLPLLVSLLAGSGILENVNPFEVVGKRWLPACAIWRGDRDGVSKWLYRGQELR